MCRAQMGTLSTASTSLTSLLSITLSSKTTRFRPLPASTRNASSRTDKEKISQLWHVNGKCPKDTIPVRRTKKDDVLRASSVKSYGKKQHRSIPKPRSADPDLVNESGHQVLILSFLYL